MDPQEVLTRHKAVEDALRSTFDDLVQIRDMAQSAIEQINRRVADHNEALIAQLDKAKGE